MSQYTGQDDDQTWREALHRAGRSSPHVYVSLFDSTDVRVPYRHARLALIRTDPARYREGHAGEVLAALCRVADRYHVVLTLTPARMDGIDGARGGLSRRALTAWYKRHGFTRNRDPRLSDQLARQPRSRRLDDRRGGKDRRQSDTDLAYLNPRRKQMRQFWTTTTPAALTRGYRRIPCRVRGWWNPRHTASSHLALAAIQAGGGWAAFFRYATPHVKDGIPFWLDGDSG